MIWWAIQQLKSKSRDTRLQAVNKLAEEGHAKAWEALLETLQDPDETVRQAVVKALGQYKDDRTVIALLPALQDKSAGVREAAALTLREMGGHDAVPALIATLPSRWAKGSPFSYNRLGDPNTMAKKLYRSVNQRMLAGVCGGLAEYFDIDVSIVRLMLIGGALVTAVLPLFFFYIIAWCIVPQERPQAQA